MENFVIFTTLNKTISKNNISVYIKAKNNLCGLSETENLISRIILDTHLSVIFLSQLYYFSTIYIFQIIIFFIKSSEIFKVAYHEVFTPLIDSFLEPLFFLLTVPFMVPDKLRPKSNFTY